MLLKPKNWEKFQHYKDRSPPWVKLHKSLLDDRVFMRLPLASKALAPLLWLLASDSKTGEFDASIDELEFRLRISGDDLKQGLKPLIDNGFFVVASGVLADCLQAAVPEAETEQRQRQKAPQAACVLFDQFWAAYPKKVGRDAAQKAFDKRKPDDGLLAAMLSTLAVQVNSPQWTKDKGQFVPNPATWLNQGRWQDEVSVGDDSSDMPDWMKGAI